MNKIMCGIALIAAMGTSVLLIGCEKEPTATIKNSFPQEFTYYQSNGEAFGTVNITEAVVSEVDDVVGATVHIKGEVTSGDFTLGKFPLEYKAYDSDGEEKISSSIFLDVDDSGVIDCTISNISLDSAFPYADDYTIEFFDYYSQVDLDLD